MSDMDETALQIITDMLNQIENPALANSRFVFEEVLRMDVNFHQFNPTRGSSYLPLPDKLAQKDAIINPKNSDLLCFKWTIITAMKWREVDSNPQRVSKLMKFESEFDWNGIGFPVSLKNICNFEINNRISVNVLAEENKQIYICRKGKAYDRVANLMLITDGNIKHYVAVKSLSRILSSRNSKHKEVHHFCMNCLQGYPNELSRDEHSRYCKNNEAVCIELSA